MKTKSWKKKWSCCQKSWTFLKTFFWLMQVGLSGIFFVNVDPPVVGSLFFDHHLWSIFLNNNLLILHKYCQMVPPHKIDASNDAFTYFSFSSCPLFFSDCYCSDWRDELECSLLIPQDHGVLLGWICLPYGNQMVTWIAYKKYGNCTVIGYLWTNIRHLWTITLDHSVIQLTD